MYLCDCLRVCVTVTKRTGEEVDRGSEETGKLPKNRGDRLAVRVDPEFDAPVEVAPHLNSEVPLAVEEDAAGQVPAAEGVGGGEVGAHVAPHDPPGA